MRPKTFLFFFLATALTAALAPARAEAQSGHKNTRTWNGSADEASNATIFYDVYRATGPCPASGLPAGATKIVSTLALIHTYVDTANLSIGVTQCYYVKAAITISGVTTESPNGSNTAGGTTPLADATGLVVASQ